MNVEGSLCKIANLEEYFFQAPRINHKRHGIIHNPSVKRHFYFFFRTPREAFLAGFTTAAKGQV